MQAMNNWWGTGSSASIRGRIWDRWDDDNLIRVKFEPFFISNSSVMQGRPRDMTYLCGNSLDLVLIVCAPTTPVFCAVGEHANRFHLKLMSQLDDQGAILC